MQKKLKSKKKNKIKKQSIKVKLFLLISVIWLILNIAVMDGHYDFQAFLVIAILPLVIGWGIYFVKKD